MLSKKFFFEVNETLAIFLELFKGLRYFPSVQTYIYIYMCIIEVNIDIYDDFNMLCMLA